MATFTQKTSNYFNKWTIIPIIGLIIYLTGGFRIITNNPAIIVILVLIILIVKTYRKK